MVWSYEVMGGGGGGAGVVQGYIEGAVVMVVVM